MSRASLFWLNGKFKASIIGQNFPIVRFFDLTMIVFLTEKTEISTYFDDFENR